MSCQQHVEIQFSIHLHTALTVTYNFDVNKWQSNQLSTMSHLIEMRILSKRFSWIESSAFSTQIRNSESKSPRNPMLSTKFVTFQFILKIKRYPQDFLSFFIFFHFFFKSLSSLSHSLFSFPVFLSFIRKWISLQSSVVFLFWSHHHQYGLKNNLYLICERYLGWELKFSITIMYKWPLNLELWSSSFVFLVQNFRYIGRSFALLLFSCVFFSSVLFAHDKYIFIHVF